MKMTDIKNCREVELSGAAYYNMIRSAVEVYPREGGGNLFGKVLQKKIVIVNAYPLQTMKRMPSSVEYGDESAVVKLRSLEDAISANGVKTKQIGGYHSHPRDDDINPSPHDSKFAQRELEELNSDYWLEMILAARCERNKMHHFGESEHTRRWHFEAALWYSIRYGYRFKIGAFIFDSKGYHRQLRIRKQSTGDRRQEVR